MKPCNTVTTCRSLIIARLSENNKTTISRIYVYYSIVLSYFLYSGTSTIQRSKEKNAFMLQYLSLTLVTISIHFNVYHSCYNIFPWQLWQSVSISMFTIHVTISSSDTCDNQYTFQCLPFMLQYLLLTLVTIGIHFNVYHLPVVSYLKKKLFLSTYEYSWTATNLTLNNIQSVIV